MTPYFQKPRLWLFIRDQIFQNRHFFSETEFSENKTLQIWQKSWNREVLKHSNLEYYVAIIAPNTNMIKLNPIMLQKVGWFGGHTSRNFFGGIKKIWTNWKTEFWPFQSSKVIPWYQGKLENSVLEGLMTHNPYNTYEILFDQQAEGINTAMNVRNMFCYAELCHFNGRH